MRTAFIRRPLEWGMVPPDTNPNRSNHHVVDTLVELVPAVLGESLGRTLRRSGYLPMGGQLGRQPEALHLRPQRNARHPKRRCGGPHFAASSA